MPLESKPDLQLTNQLNETNLNLPPEFKVDIHPDPTVPIDSEDIYRTGLGVMYDITSFPLDHAWLDRAWADPTGTSGMHFQHMDFGGKEPSHMYNQFAIWGLNHLMLSMTFSTGYCQTIAILKWKGEVIGSIYIAKRESRIELPWDTSHNRNDNARQIIPPDPRSRLTADEDIEVIIDYAGTVPIDKKLVYLTGIKAMGEAAEKSLHRPVHEMLTKGFGGINWKLIGGSGAFEGIFRPAHSRFAVMKTMAAMIRDQRFQTTHVWIKVDGKNTAAGGLSHGDLLAAS
ncbi:MAG: hypothetical protein Q9188_005683 [Gyalolechia gomerana]